jgi:hypothetical protein
LALNNFLVTLSGGPGNDGLEPLHGRAFKGVVLLVTNKRSTFGGEVLEAGTGRSLVIHIVETWENRDGAGKKAKNGWY